MLMVVTMCFAMEAMAQSGQWRDMYKAKKKDTIFGIAKKYGISMPELINANPDMKSEGYELKKGDMVFIPYSRPAVQSTPKTNALKVGVMLPLHNVDGD